MANADRQALNLVILRLIKQLQQTNDYADQKRVDEDYRQGVIDTVEIVLNGCTDLQQAVDQAREFVDFTRELAQVYQDYKLIKPGLLREETFEKRLNRVLEKARQNGFDLIPF